MPQCVLSVECLVQTILARKSGKPVYGMSFFLIKVKASQFYIYVVVQFYPWFKFYFLSFLGMIMYDNEFGTKEIKFKPRKILNHNICYTWITDVACVSNEAKGAQNSVRPTCSPTLNSVLL